MSEIRQAYLWEDGLRTEPEEKSFEWWYFDANFADGSTVVITFFTKSPSNSAGPPNPQVQITVTPPNGKKLSFNKYYPYSEFKAEKDICNVRIGPNTFSGNLKQYKIHIELPEVTGDFELSAIAPSYSTTEKKTNKPEYFGWFCAVPYGNVKANLTLNGKKKELKGTGYHDHNWGIINIKNVCDYWYWGRGNAGDYSMIYSIMYLPKILGGKQASVFYLAKGDKILVTNSNHLELTYTNIDPPTPKIGHLPKQLTFSFNGELLDASLTLTHPIQIECEDPIADEPGWQKFLTRLFSKPLYVRYNADLSLEITEKGKKNSLKGTGLYEIMILH